MQHRPVILFGAAIAAFAVLATSIVPMAPAYAQQQQQRQQGTQQRKPTQGQQQEVRELPPAGTTFVVADVLHILREAAAVQSIRQQIEKQRAAYQADLQKQENELRNADQELARQRALLAPEVFAERRKDLERRVADAQQLVQERRRSLDQAFNNAMQRVEQAMRDVIIEIVKERNYQVVLAKTQVVVVQSQLDITGEVMQRLNRKLPTVTVSIPAQK
ncbi:MAG TPA: OmpH family outer membrane protein [Alphaproteobacteria bacterium]